MTTSIKSLNQAERRVKFLTDSINVFEAALGRMEVDGWFGGAPNTKPLVNCGISPYSVDYDNCVDGGPACAGIAIWAVAHDRAKLGRYNEKQTEGYVNRKLDLFVDLNPIVKEMVGERRQGALRGIPRWNDANGVSYSTVKQAFITALATLGRERNTLLNQWGLTYTGMH